MIHIIPDSTQKPLPQLSCIARRNKIYIAANHYERDECDNATDPNCPYDNYYLYNANVVFDRRGKIIARYRKSTNYDEPWIDVPTKQKISTFVTDFGVKFGIMIGLDLMESKIIEQYVDNDEVTDVLLSTSRYDLPLMTSARDQIEFATRSKVRLLVAGYGWDGDSGIYSDDDDDSLEKMSFDKNPNALFWKTLPIGSGKQSTRSLETSTKALTQHAAAYDYDKQSFEPMPDYWSLKKFTKYGSLAIEPLSHESNTSVDKNICAGKICCRFKVVTMLTEQPSSIEQFYGYSLVVLKTTYELSNRALIDIEMCAVMACINGESKFCGKKITNDVVRKPIVKFESMSIERFVDRDNTPTSLFAPLAFLANTDDNNVKEFAFDYKKTNETIKLTTIRDRSHQDFMIFGINGRKIGQKSKSSCLRPPRHRDSILDWTEVVFAITCFLMMFKSLSIVILFGKNSCLFNGFRLLRRQDDDGVLILNNDKGNYIPEDVDEDRVTVLEGDDNSQSANTTTTELELTNSFSDKPNLEDIEKHGSANEKDNDTGVKSSDPSSTDSQATGNESSTKIIQRDNIENYNEDALMAIWPSDNSKRRATTDETFDYNASFHLTEANDAVRSFAVGDEATKNNPDDDSLAENLTGNNEQCNAFDAIRADIMKIIDDEVED